MEKSKYKARLSNPNRSAGRKTFTQTKEEKDLVNDKVYEIAQLLSKGVNRQTIKRQKAEEWDCTEQNIQYYIRKAYKSMQHSIDKRMDYILSLQRERLELCLNGAIEKKDFGTAQKILDTMNKLFGLYEEKKKVSIETGAIKFDFGNVNSNNDDVDEQEDNQ